jgi:hypothetical protein
MTDSSATVFLSTWHSNLPLEEIPATLLRLSSCIQFVAEEMQVVVQFCFLESLRSSSLGARCPDPSWETMQTRKNQGGHGRIPERLLIISASHV